MKALDALALNRIDCLGQQAMKALDALAVAESGYPRSPHRPLTAQPFASRRERLAPRG